MNSLKTVIAILMLVLMIPSYANDTEVWSGYTKITKLYPTTTGLAFITEYKNSTYSKCDEGSRFSLNSQVSDYGTQAGAIMAAFMADKEISMLFYNTSSECAKKIDRFLIRK